VAQWLPIMLGLFYCFDHNISTIEYTIKQLAMWINYMAKRYIYKMCDFAMFNGNSSLVLK